METNQNQVNKAYKDLREARKKKIINYAKTIGLAALPLAVFGGIGAVTTPLTYLIENHDLKYLSSVGLGFGAGFYLGFYLGLSGAVADYIDLLGYSVKSTRRSSDRVRECRNRIKTLETDL